MAILVSDLLEVMEQLAPASLAEPWDNIGLTGRLQDRYDRNRSSSP